MNIKGLIVCMFLTAGWLSASAYNDHRNARVDSLEAALAGSNPPKGKELLSAYDELTRGYLPYDAKKCEYYGRQALALSYEQDNLLIRQYVLRHFGLLRYGREEFTEALDYFRQALAVTDTMATQKRYTQKDLDDARSCLYGTIANVYNQQDKAHLAIHYYQLALPIFERNGWLESQTVCYHNIGELYFAMGNNAEAERNFLKAIEKGESSGDSLMIALGNKGLAWIYIGTGDDDNACQTAEKAFAYYQTHRTEEPYTYAEMLAAKARISLMEKDVAKAKEYVNEALGYVKGDMPFENASIVYTTACEVAMAEGRWQQALDYGLQSIHPDSTATYSDKDGYLLLAQIYTELGQKEQARLYINKVYEMMNRYATDHYQSGLSQMEVLYETEKKEAQIAALDKERRLYYWLLFGSIGLIALLVGLLVYRHLAHRRQKALLAAKVALETETNERRILARDLHDGLGGMLSLLRLKAGGTGTEALIDNIIVELRRTAHHLMPEELLKSGLVSALNDFAVSVPGATFSTYGDIRLDRNRELVLYRCAYELVNNAMKHACASHIDIQLMQDAHAVTLTVSDNGKGMEEDTEGMGIQNIRERTEPYHGQLNIVSLEGRGTEINITLPL